MVNSSKISEWIETKKVAVNSEWSDDIQNFKIKCP